MTSLGKSLRLLSTVLALTLALTACGDTTFFGGGEEGSRSLVSQTREVDSFDRIDVSSAIKLDVVVDPNAERSVTVTYDDNIIDMLVTRVQNGTLIIEFDGNVNLSGSANRIVEVVTPEFEGLNASGATDVSISGSTSDLALEVSGVSNVTVSGAAGRVQLDASGASDVDLSGLSVGDAAVEVSGASTIVLEASGVVSGSASGASQVRVRGNPTSVNIDTSGASSVDLP